MNKKSVLIAGGTGFIGQQLVGKFLAEGYSVKVLTRNLKKARKVLPPEAYAIKWPSDNEKLLLGNQQTCEAIINLVGENIGSKSWSDKNKKNLINSRVNSVNQLSEILKLMPQKPKVWIQASAIGYYGSNVVDPTYESGSLGSGFLATVVNSWEKAFKEVQYTAMRKVTLRLGVVIGHQAGFFRQMKIGANLGIAVCPGKGAQYLSWIHINDLVNIIYKSVENGDWNGVINCVTPEPIKMNDFAEILKRNTNAIVKIKIPDIFFRLMLGVERTRELILSNQNILPGVLQAKNFQYRFKNFQQVFDNT